MSFSVYAGQETESIKKYREVLDSQYKLSREALLDYTQEILREERESTPVPENKRQLIEKVYPQLKLICLGDVGNLLREFKSKQY